MKKIYSVAVLLLSLWTPFAQAQCPGPGPSTATPLLFSGTCRVFVNFGLPNARIVVLNASGVNITSGFPPGFTDATGSGFQFYDCNETPAAVATITNTTSCNAIVAPVANLPIKVKNFTAHSIGANSVMLRWASVFEANSYKYVVQKSTDGRNFTDVGELNAAGHSLQTINYTFNDKQASNGGSFYRLKLVDLDGSVDYTKIIYINNGEVTFTSLSIFPNPFRSEVQLKGVASSDVNRKNIRIYSAMGAEVNYRVIGGNSIVIDPSLPKGVYILRLKGQAFKLFKE